MEHLGEPNLEVAFEQKRQHRIEKAKLPFEEKLRRLVALQRMALPMLKRLGKRAVVWDIGY